MMQNGSSASSDGAAKSSPRRSEKKSRVSLRDWRNGFVPSRIALRTKLTRTQKTLPTTRTRNPTSRSSPTPQLDIRREGGEHRGTFDGGMIGVQEDHCWGGF